MTCEVKLAYILIAVLFALVLTALCCKSCVDKKIAAWVDKNPKAILESAQRFVEREQAAAQRQQSETAGVYLKDNFDRVADETNTGVANPNGTKIVVEFYDYNCGYCKMAAKAIGEVLGEDRDVKVVFRDYPILSEASVTAAQYSIAVAMAEPKKFLAFHENLFSGNAQSVQGIRAALTKSNISVEKIEKTLKNRKADIEKRINDNREIAGSLGLGGTPAFIINGNLTPGYIDAAQIRSML